MDLVEALLFNLGGKENIQTVEHCATRLRVVVLDDNKVTLNVLIIEKNIWMIFSMPLSR